MKTLYFLLHSLLLTCNVYIFVLFCLGFKKKTIKNPPDNPRPHCSYPKKLLLVVPSFIERQIYKPLKIKNNKTHTKMASGHSFI